jgi:hypothetical protein
MSNSTGRSPDRDRTAGEQRLAAAVAEQDRALGRHAVAEGTPAEIEAAVSMRAAGEQVSARERWLEWVNERDQE